MIEIKHLSKSFDTHLVLKDMNITFEKGMIFGLIGINGAGKSTFLRLISGILLPDQGEILIEGKKISEHEYLRKDIFYLSDQPPYSYQMTLHDLAKLYATFYVFQWDIYRQVLSRFHLSDELPLSRISKGMRRQGYIAIAFASGASYLLLDEVFDGLDPVARLTFKKLMIEYQTEGKIFIITSHSLRELEDICDTFGMIDEGIFKRFGNVDFELHLFKKYQIILKNTELINFKENHPKIYYQAQEGRILTLVIDANQPIDAWLDSTHYHVVDELELSFEEYFMINKGGVAS